MVRLTARDRDEGEDITSFWLVTYSDMTTLLLAFFLLMFSFQILNEQRQEELLSSLRKVAAPRQEEARPRQDLEHAAREIAAQFAGHQAFVETTEAEVTVGLPSAVTFASGSADLNDEARAALARAAAVLRPLPNALRVEGHTDDVPVLGGRYASNWELSAARAQSVVRLLLAEGVDPRRVQVLGFAAARPRAPNDGEAGRARNRRIEIKIVRDGGGQPAPASGR